MDSRIGFFGYPANPATVGQTIEKALQRNAMQSGPEVKSWKSLDIVGHFIAEEVLGAIDASPFVLADISKLNFNVTYEIGYAIGRQKPIFLTKNKSIADTDPTIAEVGIFDTIGYQEYENSDGIVSFLKSIESIRAIDTTRSINIRAPVYLLDCRHKTDWASRIVARVKKARYIFRSFDPNESPRLSGIEAISQVSESHGVVVSLLGPETVGYETHNMRAAFIAGLAAGMDKALCIMQEGDSPVPIDYRDFVSATYQLGDVNTAIADFAGRIAEAFQQPGEAADTMSKSFLQSLDLGATSAENEMRTLHDYYLNTDQFSKAIRGDAHIVVGRKGSGKSAIFLQVRDRERQRNKSKNIVLDLKPEGYKLVKFKEQMLRFLEEGTFQHTIMAFWEYVLLLEIAYKILEKDKQRHIHDHALFEPYRELNDLYDVAGYNSEGDFSERMSGLMEKIRSDYQYTYGGDENRHLSAQAVTELVYKHDVKQLEEKILGYMAHKGVLWLLFDNIDKGWPSSGIQRQDLIIIRALIEAARKLERSLSKQGNVEVHTIIFLRNDVYELLVRETSDRGKEAQVLLDWTEPDLLRELIRLRIVSNDLDAETEFRAAWLRVCTSHYQGEETSQYLIDRSLFRPRFLIDLINQCKGFAINLNHSVIEKEDIEKGVSAYSTGLLRDIGFEINDIFPAAKDVLYSFIGCKAVLSKDELNALLTEFGFSSDQAKKLRELLLWHAFLGLQQDDQEAKYIYDFNYDAKILMALIRKVGSSARYVVHPAFRPVLMVEE